VQVQNDLLYPGITGMITSGKRRISRPARPLKNKMYPNDPPQGSCVFGGILSGILVDFTSENGALLRGRDDGWRCGGSLRYKMAGRG